MPWFRNLFGSASATAIKPRALESAVLVHSDDKLIHVHQADGSDEVIAWGEISRVAIQTTDAGPFVADLFWLIESSDGGGVIVPMGATGESELLKAMQLRLEAFDNMAVVEAMGSTDRAQFTVWEADAE